MSKNFTDTILIGYDQSENDNTVLIVGRKRPNQSVDIINAFQGDEAKDLYERLITKKGEKA